MKGHHAKKKTEAQGGRENVCLRVRGVLVYTERLRITKKKTGKTPVFYQNLL